MNLKDRMIQRAVLEALVPLAVSAAKLKESMPTRTGGYSISLNEIMKKLGFERVTLGLVDTATKHLKWLVGDSADSVEYLPTDRDFVLQFNRKLTLSKRYVHFGTAAYPRKL